MYTAQDIINIQFSKEFARFIVAQFEESPTDEQFVNALFDSELLEKFLKN